MLALPPDPRDETPFILLTVGLAALLVVTVLQVVFRC